MAAYLTALRNVVGENAILHIFWPLTNLVYMPDLIEFAQP